ncbi:MAG TPA: FtsX-like permease family protein [Acidimicrobiales bacterium]|nr:FtsX-like permease family protein [Acidimicrobiales bacterium]
MSGRVLPVAWYRFRATLPRRRGGYLTVIVLLGLLGGVAMGAIAGARRTQSAFPAYLAATKASDLQFLAYGLANIPTTNLLRQLEHVPYVKGVASAPYLLMEQLGTNGRPVSGGANTGDVQELGSAGGMYFTQDKVTVAEGRMADPRRADEMVATAQAAHISGWHLGETIDFGAFTLTQANGPGFNLETTKPAVRVSLKLVGIVVLSSQVVHDDVDTYPADVLMTPALTRRLSHSGAYPTYGLRLDHGSSDVAAVERDVIGILPPGSPYTFHVTSVVEGQVERASKPEAIALGVFGAIAALAALLIAGLAISRALWENGEDLDVLRAIGADTVTTTTDALFGLVGAVVIGGLVAVGVAVGLSPLAPIGPTRQVDRAPGINFDWTVLAIGLAVLTLGLSALTVVLAYRRATRPFGERAEPVERRSRLVNAAARMGLPPSAIAGLRFSLERGHGRSAVPVRSALIGAVLAVTVVAATLTFASGLHTLDSHPALYGWNWSYAIDSPGGNNIPPAAGTLLDRDRDVAAWAGFSFASIQIDGLTVPALLTASHSRLDPPLLSGHEIDTKHEIVVGASTLAALHKKLGSTVTVSYGSPHDAPVYVPPTPLVVVGIATMPAIGSAGTLHVSMGTGVLVPTGVEPAAMRQALTSPDPNQNGPAIDVVQLRRGVTAAAGRASLQRIAAAATTVMAHDPLGAGDSYNVLGVQRPAEIVNYQSTGATPATLAAGLAVGAVVALGLTLTASVRRRRRDLALLKTLGFTPRQLATAVAWQASVAATVGIIIGLPAGIVFGRWLWTLFARVIYAVPQPSVPVLEIVLVGLGALVLANVVAAIPGRIAARTSTAHILRAE